MALLALPAAALCAFRSDEGYPLSQAAILEAAASIGLSADEQHALWQRGSYVFLCAVGGSDDTWTIENVATLPSYRRRGLTTALISRALERGRERGLKEAQITFLIGNELAERTYINSGFRLTEERRHPEFEAKAGAPGLRRMVRRL